MLLLIKMMCFISGAIVGVHSFDTNEVQIDLREGIVSGYSPYIEFLTAPNHSPNGQCNSQAVIKVDLSGKYRSINLFLEYGDTPRQWTLDISDSETGDGNGGDNGTTGNMAETQICNRQLRIYGNNRPGHMDVSANGGLLMKIVDNFVKKGAKVNLNISDESVEWAHGKKRGHLESEFLFTLNGQKPSYGDVDYNVYIAFNRVVAGAYRNGSGLCKANIVLVNKPVSFTRVDQSVRCLKPLLAFLEDQDVEFYKFGLLKLKKRWVKCIDKKGYYVEK